MYRKFDFACRRLPLLVAAGALLFAPFLAAGSYADELPFKAEFAGTLVPIPVNNYLDDNPATVLDGLARGAFGVKMVHVVTEWAIAGMCDDGYVLFRADHAAYVITFANGDQLFGAGSGDEHDWMCMDVYPFGDMTGRFYGEAGGDFMGGTGRFEGATGSFVSPFSGINITTRDFNYGFGPISGTMEGMVTMP